MASSGVSNLDETGGGARRLTAAEVRWTCGPNDLPFRSTAELTPPDALIGQERAERSLEFGVDIRSRGFNIYAAGIPGTGRTSMIMARLQAEAARRPSPDDWCYVHNFDDSHRPRALRLPAGQAPTFQAQLREVVETLRHDMQRAFDTEEYQNQRDAVTQAVQTERREAFSAFEQQASDRGFEVRQLPAGLGVSPVRDGRPMSSEALRDLPEAERERIQAASQELEERLGRLMRRLRRRQRAARSTLSELSADVARSVARPLLDDLREEYRALPHVTTHLDAIESHITQHHENFLESDSTALPTQGRVLSPTRTSPIASTCWSLTSQAPARPWCAIRTPPIRTCSAGWRRGRNWASASPTSRSFSPGRCTGRTAATWYWTRTICCNPARPTRP